MCQPNCSFGEVTWPCAERIGATARATPRARAARRARRRGITDMADPGAVGELGLGHRPGPTTRYARATGRVEHRARLLRSGPVRRGLGARRRGITDMADPGAVGE